MQSIRILEIPSAPAEQKPNIHERQNAIMEAKLNVGVIGCGMGRLHAQGVLKQEGACLYALCDTDPDVLANVGNELNVERRFTDYRDMIADPAIGAVVIASPDQLHREMIRDCLAAGKHILCEKPLALTREDIDDIVAMVRASDRKFMVGQICRYTPGFAKAKERIDAGAIGELTFVESEYAHDYTHVFGRKGGSWRCDPVRNGVVGGGCHAVDLLRWIAGNPEEVMAYGVHKTFETLVPYDDTHIAVLKFPNGVIGKVFVSISCRRSYTMRSVFYGTRGTIIVDNTSPEMTLFRMDENDKTVTETIPLDINNHNAAGEFREFYDIIVNDKPVKTTVEEGANTIAACLAIVDSANSGKLVQPKYFA